MDCFLQGRNGWIQRSNCGEEILPKLRVKSPVWTYFVMEAQSGDKVICRECRRTVSAKNCNTSNLFSHLKNNHPRLYDSVKKASQDTQKRTTVATEKNFRLSSIVESLTKFQKYNRKSRKWQSLTDSVTHFLAKDILPFYSVEKQGFKRMIASFDERYELPSRKYFSRTAIPALYNLTREAVAVEVQQAEFFSATTDLWSSEGLRLYMSYTVHYINKEWKLLSKCLRTTFLPQDHTGENLAKAFTETLTSWGLHAENQVCLTTDSGSNIVCAAGILKWTRLACFGHNLHLAVTNSLNKDPCCNRALGVARKITSAFSMSWKRRRDLAQAQIKLKLPQHSLITDCVTRWGSSQRMVSRILEQEAAVRSVLGADRKPSNLLPT